MARGRLTHNTGTPQVVVRNPLAMYQPSQGFVTKAFAIATQMGYDPSNYLRVKNSAIGVTVGDELGYGS
jgi:hypothetical protein